MKTLYFFPLMDKTIGRITRLPNLSLFPIALVALVFDAVIHGPALLMVLAVAGMALVSKSMILDFLSLGTLV